MKKLLSSPLFYLFLFCLGSLPAISQWTEIPRPSGAYIYDDMEASGGKVYTSFYADSSLKCFVTSDYIHWSLVADLDASGSFGLSRIIPDSNRLFLFGFNKYQKTADAWRSDNGGQSWQLVSLPSPKPYLLAPYEDVLLCAVDSTIMRSADGGASWDMVLAVPGKLWDMKRLDGQTTMLTSTGYIYLSHDLGLSWDTLPAPYNAAGINSPWLTIYPTGEGIFVELDEGNTSTLFHSSDEGESWNSFPVPSMYDNSNISDLLSLGGLLWGVFNSGIATSGDGGDTWEFRPTPNGTIHIEAFGDTIFAGGTNGFFKSYDQGNSWLSGNLGWSEEGIPLSTFLYYNAFFASQDELYLSTNEGLFSTDNDGIEWQLYNDYGPFTHHFYSGDTLLFLGKGAMRSFDGGASWDYLQNDSFPNPLYGQYSFARVGNYLFASAWFDGNFYRSEDFGTSWQVLQVSFFFLDFLVAAGNTLYATDSDGIQASTNYGQSFSLFNNGLGSHPFAEGLWGVQENVFTKVDGQLWRRDGSQWKPASAGLYDDMGSLPFIVGITGVPGTIALAGRSQPALEALLYLSYDEGVSWEGGWAEGLPPINERFSALLHNGTIYAMGEVVGEYAPRIWKRSLSVGVDEASPGIAFEVFPNPASDVARVVFGERADFQGRVVIHDFTGRLVWQREISGQVDMDIPLNNWLPGVYCITVFSNGGLEGRHKLLVQR